MNAHSIGSGSAESNGAKLGDILGQRKVDANTKHASANSSNLLIADENEIRRFVTTLFRRCVVKGDLPFGGRLALRAFRNDDGDLALSEWEPLAGKPIARATKLATQIAQRPRPQGAVFAPPVCLFKDEGRARVEDVFACPVIVVELDAAPAAGKQTLEALLGPATVVVASGGRWTSPEGITEDKLHLYWRLTAPAIDEDDKAILRAVRHAAAELVGADKTAVPLAHPLRWPGSWHTKAEPRLCRIVAIDDTSEITLAHAATCLNVDIAAARVRRRGVRADGQAFTTRTAWTAAQLSDVAARIANPDLDWDQWNRIGMAIYDAAHGSDEGLEAFDLISQKSSRYDEDTTVARYDHYSSSPPDRISGSWLIDRVREQVDPTYCLLAAPLPDEEREEIAAAFRTAADSQVQREAEEARPKPASGLRVVTGLIAPASIPVRRWLIAPRLPIGDVCQCVGEPGISKSTFMLRDALVIATGREDILRGKDGHGGAISWERLHRSGPVLIYNAEDRLDEMERRLTAAQRHAGLGEDDLKHPIVLWSGVDHEHLIIMKRTEARGALKPATGLASLEATIRQYGVVMVALDPQVSLVSGAAENSNDDADALFQELARLAFRTGCSVLVVHHTSKQTRDAAGDAGAGRGGFAAVGKVRSAFTLTNVTGKRDDEEGWNLEGQSGGLVRLDYSKQSHEKKPSTPLIFRRLSVAVGNGSGVRPEAAAALFEQDPRAALEMSGDNAPVLELVDIATLSAQGGSKTLPAHAEAIARVVSEIVAERSECSWGAIWSVVGARLREQGIATARGRPSVTGHVMNALTGGGVELIELGHLVRIRAEQRGKSEKAPWIVMKTVVTAEGSE